MDYPLDGCWTKLARAVDHLSSLDAEIEAWLRDERAMVSGHLDRETDICTLYLDSPTPPLRWGAVIGDVVHNLRSALDHLVSQLVLFNGEVPRKGSRGNSFPILKERPDDFVKTVCRATLRGVHQDHINMIEALQPYQQESVEDNELLILNELSNTDKHRLINTVVFLPSRNTPSAENLIAIADVERIEKIATAGTGAQEGAAEIARFKITRSGPHPELEVSGRLNVEVALEDGRNPIAELSGRIAPTVEQIVNHFISVFGDWTVSSFFFEQDLPRTGVVLEVEGAHQEATRVVTELDAKLGDWADIRMDDPQKVAGGDGGRIEVVVAGAETKEAARAVLNAVLDQIPNSKQILQEIL